MKYSHKSATVAVTMTSTLLCNVDFSWYDSAVFPIVQMLVTTVITLHIPHATHERAAKKLCHRFLPHDTIPSRSVTERCFLCYGNQ